MKNEFSYVFPAIRGIQAGREYYVSMCPLRLIPKLFQFDGEEMLPELRAQRVLNKVRVPEIAQYIVDNQDNYTFSAITASIDGEVNFEPIDTRHPTGFRVGSLTVSMQARFIVNDGQHRRAAIETALQSAPNLGDETIAVVFFVDRGLARSQQMFADLNRHAVKPSASIGVLYDHRNIRATLARDLCLHSSVFKSVIELERSSLAERSRKLFTLSALDGALAELLTDEELEDYKSAALKAERFWKAVGEQIPEWSLVKASRMTSGEVRKEFIHSHAITLQAIARVGKALTKQYPTNWESRLKRLAKLDWSRRNVGLWEGRAMMRGKMEKSTQSLTLTANAIKTALGMKLEDDEMLLENSLNKWNQSGDNLNGRHR